MNSHFVAIVLTPPRLLLARLSVIALALGGWFLTASAAESLTVSNVTDASNTAVLTPLAQEMRSSKLFSKFWGSEENVNTLVQDCPSIEYTHVTRQEGLSFHVETRTTNDPRLRLGGANDPSDATITIVFRGSSDVNRLGVTSDTSAAIGTDRTSLIYLYDGHTNFATMKSMRITPLVGCFMNFWHLDSTKNTAAFHSESAKNVFRMYFADSPISSARYALIAIDDQGLAATRDYNDAIFLLELSR